ncbi:hypothetical protein FPQ18DRAFT_306062 [Pyronema domesticum]|nr:hypothetical protein FPQ18DRAFT_306062 [Pyronema domesticum]
MNTDLITVRDHICQQNTTRDERTQIKKLKPKYSETPQQDTRVIVKFQYPIDRYPRPEQAVCSRVVPPSRTQLEAPVTPDHRLCDSLVGDLMRVGDFIMNSVVVVVVMRRREQARKKEEVIRANTFNLIELVDLKLFACALKRKCRFLPKHAETGTKRPGNGKCPKTSLGFSGQRKPQFLEFQICELVHLTKKPSRYRVELLPGRSPTPGFGPFI